MFYSNFSLIMMISLQFDTLCLPSLSVYLSVFKPHESGRKEVSDLANEVRSVEVLCITALALVT